MSEFNSRIKDATVIVRSVEERTERECISRLERFFGCGNVLTVRNAIPFIEAIRQSFSLGIKEKKRWTLIVDADVIVYDKRLFSFLTIADELIEKDEKLFCIQPYVYDMFFKAARHAGIHLYNSEYLCEGLKFVDNIKLRPETYVKRMMAEEGHLTYSVGVILGIHDFFQYYEDIIAKGILHSHKHTNISNLERLWKESEGKVVDFKYIIMGADIGRKIKKEDIRVDREYMRLLYQTDDIPEQIELDEDLVERTMCDLEHKLPVDIIIKPSKKRKDIVKDTLLCFPFFMGMKKIKDRWFGKKDE